MMKTVGKKNFKIIAACSVAIFSLLAVCGGVYSWFTLELRQALDDTEFAVVNLGTCDLYSIELYKFNYYVHQYGTSEVVDYFNPETGNVAKYSYNKTLRQFGYMDGELWHQVSMMNTYDPVELQLFNYGVRDLNCNVVYKFTISTIDLNKVKMDSTVSKIIDAVKQDSELFLSGCTDFDLYMESDLEAITDKSYYPSYIEQSETLTEEETLYYKISYLSSLVAEDEHPNLYSPASNATALTDTISTEFIYGAGEEMGFLTVYVNVNYAPSQLQDTMYRIYQENIKAVCDFNFQFYFAMEDEE